MAGTAVATRRRMETGDIVEAFVTSDLVDDPARTAEAEPRRAVATAQRRRRWGKQAALAGVALGAIGGFLAVSRAIAWERSNALDRAVVRGVGRARGPAGNLIARMITFFGAVSGVTVVSATALGLARKRPRLAMQIATGALGGVLAELGIKHIFRRSRPTLLEHLEHVSSTSFPSGHSMAAASFYLTLAFVGSRNARLRPHRAGLIAGGSAVAVAIGATRVYLGVHWPTDVLGGLALGTAWACASEAAFDLAAATEIEAQVP